MLRAHMQLGAEQVSVANDMCALHVLLTDLNVDVARDPGLIERALLTMQERRQRSSSCPMRPLQLFVMEVVIAAHGEPPLEDAPPRTQAQAQARTQAQPQPQARGGEGFAAWWRDVLADSPDAPAPPFPLFPRVCRRSLKNASAVAPAPQAGTVIGGNSNSNSNSNSAVQLCSWGYLMQLWDVFWPAWKDTPFNRSGGAARAEALATYEAVFRNGKLKAKLLAGSMDTGGSQGSVQGGARRGRRPTLRGAGLLDCLAQSSAMLGGMMLGALDNPVFRWGMGPFLFAAMQYGDTAGNAVPAPDMVRADPVARRAWSAIYNDRSQEPESSATGGRSARGARHRRP